MTEVETPAIVRAPVGPVKTFAIRNLGAAPFCFFEAKSLLRKLLGSKAAVSVLGPGAQSLAEKYFTG